MQYYDQCPEEVLCINGAVDCSVVSFSEVELFSFVTVRTVIVVIQFRNCSYSHRSCWYGFCFDGSTLLLLFRELSIGLLLRHLLCLGGVLL